MLKTLLDKLFETFWEWFKQLSVVVRMVMLVCAIIVIATIYLSPTWVLATRIWRAGPREIPLSRAVVEKMDGEIKSLETTLGVQLSQAIGVYYPLVHKWKEGGPAPEIDDVAFHAWSFAQSLIAMNQKWPVPANAVQALMEYRMGPECSCWRQYPRVESPRHIGATSWVIYGTGRYRIPAPYDVLEFLLSNQKRGGWWPIYPATESHENASTYATAWGVLALNEQLRYGLVTDSTQRERAEAAVKAGVVWLLSVREPNAARWKDYPLSAANPTVSLSNSGLVIHVLHALMKDDFPRQVDRLWLAELPNEISGPARFEASNRQVHDQEQMHNFDAVRYYVLPWLLIGTVDAYGSGSTSERAKAVRWLERAVNAAEASDVLRFDWISAELLIALRHLKDRDVL